MSAKLKCCKNLILLKKKQDISTDCLGLLRSNALTVYMIYDRSKYVAVPRFFSSKNVAWKHGSKKIKLGFQLWSANLVFASIGVHKAQTFGCAAQNVSAAVGQTLWF